MPRNTPRRGRGLYSHDTGHRLPVTETAAQRCSQEPALIGFCNC